jgi:hypothetical protein
MSSRGVRTGGHALLASVATLALGACSDQTLPTLPVQVGESVPTMPRPTVGSVTIGGHVRDDVGSPVAGATIQVAETDARATTDADGAYRVEVPSDSTVTLSASAPGTALTFRESVVVAAGARIEGFDFALLATERVATYDALGRPGLETMRGLMAVRLHALDTACAPSGAHLSVWPPLAATIVYGAPAAPGMLGAPDPAATSVPEGADVALWLAGTMPPANDLRFDVDVPGCRLASASPSFDGLTFPGQRHVVPAALTLVDLFLERAP